MNDERLSQLIDSWRDDDLSEEQADELNQILRESEEARRKFSAESRFHGLLHCAAAEDAVQRVSELSAATLQTGSRTSRATSWPAWRMMLSAIAAGLFVAIGFQWWHWSSESGSVATLTSSENAAWESELPTTPGSELTPGVLSLRTGVATVRFHSGAEVIVEAPAQLQLISSMRGKLLSGAAVIDVPDSAIGFVIETPDGYAVDYGTRFAVRVDQQEQQSNFEILEGEIVVHHPSNGEELRLTGQGKAARVSAESVIAIDLQQQDDSPEPDLNVVRIDTQGRSSSAVRNNKRRKYIHPDFLSVKNTEGGKWDHRSYFDFDLSTVDLNQAGSARLRLNLVPSHLGFATRLPRINRFGIYGLTNPVKSNWSMTSLWEESPGPEDGVLLGTFEVPRSQQQGSFGIRNDELLDFLKQHQVDGSVTLILVRETTQIEGNVPGLTHMFASDSHPEYVGPMLEFVMTR
ncbi:FecR domain-containing protein [Rubinisphaera margarita]|uniref:FecR domain-containing protein n=1 Tax=Rubinisphaera margarita TaxID=2909586 RepID=UPI001EE8AB7D|nr:FecR domain-containing protein [Rubinisphaera margarita]MCG6158025.1 FecR family protein [Rubinisphaera margarita]